LDFSALLDRQARACVTVYISRRRRAYIVNGVAVDDHLMGYVFEG